MKKTITILVLLLTQMVFGQMATAPAAGDGTSGNPYQIASLANLYWIAATDAVVPNPTQANRSTAYYIQMNDIDASATSTWDGGKGFYRIADGTTVFTGTYDGGEHKITGLVINRPLESQVGLFGYCYSGCSIKNLTLENCNVIGRERTGGLIGLLYHNDASTTVTISNCHVSGTISGYSQAGGLIGYLWEGAGATGGETYNVFVNNCSASATVSTSSTARLGVLIGQCEGNSLTKNPRISKCFSSGSAASNSSAGHVGGLIGSFEYVTISNCYSTASITGNIGDDAGGGFIGSAGLGTDIGYCYSTGTVSGFGDLDQYGFIGYYNGSPNVHHCYWDTETSGYTDAGIPSGAAGKTTVEMKTHSTYVEWDFTNTWWMADGETRPILRTEWSTTIGNSHQLQLMSMDLTAAYVLNNNIDLSDIKVQKEMWGTSGSSGSGFVPIGNGSTHFTGSFDGQGFAIDGLYITRPAASYIGLFGSASAAAIQNLGVTNIDLTGTGNVGGIVGYTLTSGSISNCYTTGTITANNDHVGGLVGYNWKANISRCYANVNVTVTGSRNYTGGLIGINTDNNTISDCYSRGDVSGYNYVGGLVGSHTMNTLIDKCYSIGNVTGTLNTGGLVGYNNSTVTASFWNSDIEALGIGGGTTTGATGKTTDDMKTQSTFLDAGWSSAIWNIGDGFNAGYPYLDWQNPSGTPLPVELTSFTASVSGGKVTLNWQTATEVNNYGFEIQRSVVSSQLSVVSDQRSEWETISFVEGNGNSNSPKDYSYIDENVAVGNYLYRLKQIDNNGEFSYSSEVEVNIEAIPTEFALYQNYPNPFNPETTIKYSVPEQTYVTVKLFDISGSEIKTLVNEVKPAGVFELKFNANSCGGLPSGVYFYKLTTENFSSIKKMILMK